MRCCIHGVAVLGPGLPGWAASEAILAGAAPWVRADIAVPPPALLAATERRRTSLVVRLALAAACEATAGEADPAALETIFVSGNGDGVVVGDILEALHDPAGVALSPTQFHNSVHNAPAGYWHIGARSTAPSLSLGGHDNSFAAGLLMAATAVATRRHAVLLCAYDLPMPAPLDTLRPTTATFAAALVLRPEEVGATPRAVFDLRYLARPAAEPLAADGLDALAAENPAARALPLLRALAARRAVLLHLPMHEDAHLELRLAPC